MISQLKGALLEATPAMVVIDVGGMGFELGISASTAAALPAVGSEVLLYTRMLVREDSCTLFGFAAKDERAMFDRLVAVSGVGAKLALAVLSKFSVPQLYSIIMAEDDAGMTAVPGVGKKTAQRLILELKGVLAKDGGWDASSGAAPHRLDAPAHAAPSSMEDASSALLSMGFTAAEVSLALDGYDGRDMRVEDLLSAALRRLGMDA